MRWTHSLLIRWLLAGAIAASHQMFYPLIGPLTLQVSYDILRSFTDAILQGGNIYVSGYTLTFIPACAAISAYTLLWILILLTREISLKTGLLMALYGSLLIFAANILRIELLIYALLGVGKNLFDTLHLFIWTVVSSVYVVGVWLFLTWRFKVKGIPLWSDIQYARKKVKR